MNRKKVINKFIFSLLFLFIICCSFKDVKANNGYIPITNCCKSGDILISVDENGGCLCESSDLSACKDLVEDGELSLAAVAEKYDATIAKYGSSQVIITIDPTDKNDSSVLQRLKDVRFKLVSINGVTDTRNLSVGYQDPLILDQVLNGDKEMIVLLRIQEDHLDPDCRS